MSGEDGQKVSSLDAVADAALEVLATSWPVAETDEEMESIVDNVESGGDQ